MSLKHLLVAGTVAGALFGGSAAVAWAQTTTPTDPSTPSTSTPSAPDQAPSTTPQSPEGHARGNCPGMGDDSGSSGSGSSGSSTDAQTAFHMSRSSSSGRF